MHAFIKRFLMHYGVYRRYPLGRFPALRNAWRVLGDLLAVLTIVTECLRALLESVSGFEPRAICSRELIAAERGCPVSETA